MKKRALVSLLMILALALCSCGKKKEEQKQFFSSPSAEMLDVDDCGFDRSYPDSVLGMEGITVMSSYFPEMDGTEAVLPETSSSEESGILLTAYDHGMDQYASRYGFDDWISQPSAVDELISLLPVQFSHKTVDYLDICSDEVGIQIELRLPGKGSSFYFAAPSGYIFTPAVPSEYTSETHGFLLFANLPSGLKYAEFAPESFARVAVCEAAYSAKAFAVTEQFEAYGTPDSEPSGYRLCVSSKDAHIDLSLFQAREFLERYLGSGENGVTYTGFELAPDGRPDSADLIEIREYCSYGETESVLYLAPDGRLLKLNGSMIWQDLRQGTYFGVRCAMITSSEPSYGYKEVKELLEAYTPEGN